MASFVALLQSEWAKMTGLVTFGVATYKLVDDRLQKRRDRFKATFAALDEWRENGFTEDRHYLATTLMPSLNSEQIEKGIRGLEEEDQKRFNRVSYYLDYLGHAIELGFLDERVVLVMIGGSVQQLWEKMAPLIYAERIIKKKGHQGGFEHIASQASCKPNSLAMPFLSTYNRRSVHPATKGFRRRLVFWQDNLASLRILRSSNVPKRHT